MKSLKSRLIIILVIQGFLFANNKELKLLFNAIEKNDLNAIKKIVNENNIIINSKREKDRKTPILLAAEKNNINIIELLINNEADINIMDKEGKTPLLEAVKNDNYELVKLLLDNGAEPNLDLFAFNTPLVAAIKNQNLKMVNLLLENGANPNTKVYEKDDYLDSSVSPIYIATRLENIDLINLLIKFNADLNEKSHTEGMTPLILAITRNNLNIINLLLTNKVDLNIKTNYSNTALMNAASSSTKKVVELLLINGADYRLKTRNEETALIYAARSTRVEIVDFLLENTNILNLKLENNDTAYKQILRYLEEGKNWNWILQEEKNRKIEKINDIINLIERKVKTWKIKAYKAIEENDIIIFNYFIKKIGSSCFNDKKRNNLLHYIINLTKNETEEKISKREKFIYNLLILNPGLIEQSNNLGLSPIEYALSLGNFNIVKIFLNIAFENSKNKNSSISKRKIKNNFDFTEIKKLKANNYE